MKLLLAGILGFAIGGTVEGTLRRTFAKHAPVPSIYATVPPDGSATCYANGKAWPARVDGTTVNCFSADMPTN